MQKRIMGMAIKRKLGKGAFGEVYLVADQKGNLFAAKCMAMTPQMIQGQLHEAILHTSLEHPSLLKAHQAVIWKEEMVLVILMEFCDQGSLADVIENIGKLIPDKSKKRIFIQRTMLEIAKGIEHLHCERRVVHRDLKPQNILVKDGLPKISDFGLSKPIDSIAMTKCGTPWYMSREQLEAKKYSYEVDIWALGIIFLEMLLEKRIYDMMEGMQQPCNRDDFPTQQMIKGLPSDKARNMIVAMLKRNPQDRPGIKQIVKYLTENDLFNNSNKKQVVAVVDKKVIDAIVNMMVAIQVRKALNAEKEKALPLSPPPPANHDRSEANIVVGNNQPPPANYCKNCRESTQETTRLKPGRAAWTCACILTFTIPILCCLPFCTEKYKDRLWECAKCGEVKRKTRAEGLCDCCECCMCEDCCWD